MASVHQINLALAAVRGIPWGSVEQFSRRLRAAKVLPATKTGSAATPITPTHAALMLFAVMRGSPTTAAENARELGGLVAHSDGGALLEPVLTRQLKALGWEDGITLANAVGWFIDLFANGSVDQVVATTSEAPIGRAAKVIVEVDRYWTSGSIRWIPSLAITEEYLAGMREAFGNTYQPDRRLNGHLNEYMRINFASPLLHEAKIAYGVDKKCNAAAHKKFQAQKAESEKYDVYGTELVTERTLVALADVFRNDCEASN